MSSKSKRNGTKRVTQNGPPPRAAIELNAVMTRSGNFDFRRLRVGPNTVAPEDVTDLLVTVVSMVLCETIKTPALRGEAVQQVIDLLPVRMGNKIESTLKSTKE